MTVIRVLLIFLPVVCFGQTGASQVFTRQNGTGAVLRSVENKGRETVSVQDFGAKGDGTTDDTAAIIAAKIYACSLANAGTVNGSKLFFPVTGASYLVSSTVSLCSYLEIEGYRAKVHYSGAGSLFTIPRSVDGSIHGLILEGSGIADTWGITCAGTSGIGCLTEHIYDIRIRNFGDIATHSGGGIQVLADSGKMTVNNVFFTTNGTGFLTSGPTDSLNNHDNYFADLGRCMDFGGQTGAASISASHNNLSCNGGGIRTVGPGTYIFAGNEYESTGAITNSNQAAYEFLGSADGPGIVTAIANFAGIHDDGIYCYYVDGGSTGPVYTNFIGNNCQAAFPVDATQYAIYNGNVSITNRFQLNNMYQPTANLYKFPNDPGVVVWPMSSSNLTDFATIIHGNTSAGVTTLTTGDYVFNPLTFGNKVKRIGTGTGNGQGWGWQASNSADTDSSILFESSANYTTGGILTWCGNSMTCLYTGSHFRIGSGIGSVPVMLSDGPGKTGFGGLPVAANNAAAITGGLSVGMFYRTGADPDPVMVVH